MLRTFSYSFKSLKKDALYFGNFINKNKLSAVLIWFFLLLAYGIKLFYYSISIDTELIINDYDSLKYGWFSINRAGLIITKKVLGLIPFNPYVATFLMLSMMFSFCMLLSFIFYSISEKFKVNPKYTFVLPCVFATHPLFAEQFNFTLQTFEVAFAFCLMFLAIFFYWGWFFDQKNKLYPILGVAILSYSFLHYQAIVFLYISVALACFFYVYINNLKNPKKELDASFFRKTAAKNVFVFILSFCLYFAASKCISIYFKLNSSYTDNMVTWGKIPFFSSVKQFLGYIKLAFMGDHLFYSKLFILVTLIAVFYFVKFLNFKGHTNKVLYFFVTLAFGCSPFFLALILGRPLIPRMQFSYQFFIAFVLYAFLQEINKFSFAKFFVVLGSLYVSFCQGYKVANLMYTDYMKYQSEIALAAKIDEKISALDIENVKNVPVAFVGGINVFGTPNPTSGEVINLSFFYADRGSVLGSTLRILGLMKTVGYNYKIPTDDECKKALQIANSMKEWPSPLSVNFKDGIIVVKLSKEY